ncbi:MAG: 50S ribosomal protein L5 [Patescibacteria group bacterium]|nr:MAG: 50S ribosomal protein L5 [Patescibacteria group bacterium]
MLREIYEKQVAPDLMKHFGYKNRMAVPKLKLVSVNVGMSTNLLKDPKIPETVESTLTRITGQKPVKTLAKKSIASFKIREGQHIGMKVTLRGDRMWHFLEKLIHVTMPRIRDFRGISPKLVDKQGNLSIGFKEYIAFPEIRSDEIERLHGVQVTVSSTAKTREEGLELFKRLGFPFHG